MSALLLVCSLYLPLLVFLGVVAQAVIPTGPQIASKPLAWFKVKSNVRKHFDEASLRALGKDLRIRQLSPLVCLADGTIICGERRYRAALLEGLTHLDVIIVTDAITEAEHKRLQLVENIQREELSNSAKAEGCVEFARCNPQMTFKQIAEALHVDASLITRWMSWSRAIDLLRQALSSDSITLTTFYAIAQKPQEEQEAALSEAINGKKPAKKSSGRRWRLQCEMPSGTVVTLASEGDGLGLDSVIETLAELLKAAKKANDEGLNARTWERVLKDKARA